MCYVSLSLSPFPFLLLDHGLYAQNPLFGIDSGVLTFSSRVRSVTAKVSETVKNSRFPCYLKRRFFAMRASIIIWDQRRLSERENEIVWLFTVPTKSNNNRS